jgi:hypothetical protein
MGIPIGDGKRRQRELEGLTLLEEQLARLTGEVKALRTEKDRSVEVTALNERIETMKRERDRLTETHDREVRETEHAVGLLRRQTEADAANMKRAAELGVQQQNLNAEKALLKRETDFQREFLERYAGRMEDVLATVIAKVPDVSAVLKGTFVAGSAEHEDDAEGE